jgi:hypothetical protein
MCAYFFSLNKLTVLLPLTSVLRSIYIYFDDAALLFALYKIDSDDDEIYAYVKLAWMEIKLNVCVEPWAHIISV